MSSSGAIKGRYEKRQVLGEGGMGVVYRAYDADLKREVALKTLRDGGDELALEMFRKECGVLASLNHPNIVDIYDVGQFEEEGVEKPYFVMPLLPGTTLDRIIKNEPQRLTVDRTVEIISQTCRGLHAAHERGLIHRDLKPSNIFVLADDSVKIIDFGIAHLTGTHTSLGLKGTIYYMAPEQMEMKPASPQSDIYSLGVVCFEILGRRRPFIGTGRDEVIRAIMRSSPPPVFELNPSVNQGVSQVIHAALAKKPYNRYQTSREFADCLQKALRNQPIERFSNDKVVPRVEKVEKALAGQEYEFANEVLTELEEEGQLHPDIRSLRGRLDQVMRDRTLGQLMDSAKRRLGENEFQLALQKVQEVLQIDPRHAGALGLRADIESRRSTDQIDGWVRLARQHLDNQKISLAREALGNALAINPHDSNANSLRVQIERSEQSKAEAHTRRRELYDQARDAWQKGDVTAALSKIEKVIEVSRPGKENGAENDLDATYQAFYNKVRSEHDSIQSRYEEAKHHLANGNFTAAGELCEGLVAKYPNHALFQALRFDVGEAARQAVSADMARVDREVEAEPDLDRRVSILEEAVARHPQEAVFKEALQGVASKRDLVNSIAAKARAQEESGHFQEAISQWDILRNIYPQFPGLDFEVERLQKRRQQQARADAKGRWAERIDGAMNSGDHTRAIELAASALAEFPGDPELAELEKLARQGHDRGRQSQELLARAQQLRSEGKLDEAAAALREASALDSKNPAARGALVELLVAQAGSKIEQDWNAADTWIDQALSLDASHTQARSLKTLVGDKRREAGVSESLGRARQLQGAGDLKGAYREVLAGLAAYPLDGRLTQLKSQLGRAVEELDKSVAPTVIVAPAPAPPPPPAAAPPKPVAVKSPGKSGSKQKQPPAPPPAAPKPAAAAAAAAPPIAKPVEPPAPPKPPEQSGGGSKPPLWIAALAVPILGGLGWFLMKPAAAPPPTPAESGPALVAFDINVTPASAKIRAAGKDFGVTRRLELPEGDYQLEVFGDGIKTQQIPLKVMKGMAAPAPIQAEVEPPALVLALSGARATLDGKLVTAAGGRMVLEPGDHRLEFFQGTGRGVVEFSIAPGTMPAVKTAAGQGIFLTAVAVLGPNAKMFGGRKGGLGPDLADVPATGLDLTGLGEQPQPLRVSDGTETRAYDLTAAAAPTLAVFVADPGRVDLTILSNQEGATVQINGKPSGPIQKGQRLEQLAPGVYRVRVTKPGFIDLPERAITLTKGRAAREQFELKAALASLKIVGGAARAQVNIDGRSIGEIKPGEPFLANIEPGRHRVSLKAEHHQAAEREIEFKVGSESLLAWRELMTAVGYVQLSVAGANQIVTYTSAGAAPKTAAPGTLTIPAGEYTFKAVVPGAGEQTQPVSVKLGQTVPVAFAPPAPKAPAGTSDASKGGTGSSSPSAASLFGNEWKEDDGWKKLDSGRQSTMAGSLGSLVFQVRRKGGVLGLGGRPGWLYLVGASFVRFELSGDKLTWWVTQGNTRDKKAGESPVPKEAEEVRIDITADSISHTIGSASSKASAAELGFTSFASGQFRFRGPISIKGLSPRLR